VTARVIRRKRKAIFGKLSLLRVLNALATPQSACSARRPGSLHAMLFATLESAQRETLSHGMGRTSSNEPAVTAAKLTDQIPDIHWIRSVGAAIVRPRSDDSVGRRGIVQATRISGTILRPLLGASYREIFD